jgi:hypothetical protein
VENVALQVKEKHHVSNVVQENPVVEKVADPVVDPASIVDITNLITQIETEANTSASIDNSLTDKAATKIQSTYRGYKTRTEFKKQKILNGQVVEVLTSSIIENSVDAPKTQSAESQSLENSISQNQQIITESHQVSQNDQQESARSQTLDTSKLVDEPINSINQSKDLNDAATKIQSTYRGYKIRKDFITNKNAISISKLEATTTTFSIPLDSSSINFSSSSSNNNNNHMNDDDNDDYNNNTNENNALSNSPTNNDKVLSKKQKKNKKKQNKKH